MCACALQAESPVVELGEMLVGGSRTVEVPLVNSSLCPVSVGLEVQQTLLDQELLTSDPGCTEPLGTAWLCGSGGHLGSRRPTVFERTS